MPQSNQILEDGSPQTTKKLTISWASSMCVQEFRPHPNPKLNWYQREELLAIRDVNKQIPSKLCSGVDDNEDDCRGLEQYMDPTFKRTRTLRRRAAILTVLSEQQDQWDHGTPSPEFIAELYQELCFCSMNDARVRGVQDQHAAAEIHQGQYKKGTSRRVYKKLFGSVIRPKQVLAQSA